MEKLTLFLSKIEFGFLAPTAITFRILRRQLKKTVKYVRGDLLDVGCGNRPYEDIFLPCVQEYVGVDITKGPRVDIVADTSKGLPIESQTYDTIICTEMLEHTPYPRESIKELARVLKKGGYLILSTPFVHKLHGEPFDYFRYSQHILKVLAEEAGLETIEFYYVGTSIAVLGRTLGDIIYSISDVFCKGLFQKIIRTLCMIITAPMVLVFCVLDYAVSKVSFLKHNTLGFVLVARK